MLVEIWDQNTTGLIDLEEVTGVMEIKGGKPGKSITDVKRAIITRSGNFTVTLDTHNKVTAYLFNKHNHQFLETDGEG